VAPILKLNLGCNVLRPLKGGTLDLFLAGCILEWN
jgi:hypothetical protein